VEHDPVVQHRLKHDARYYLGNLYFDAVAYGPEELGFVSDVISRADGYRAGATTRALADRSLGSKRMMFGTDHPFFPPLGETEKYVVSTARLFYWIPVSDGTSDGRVWWRIWKLSIQCKDGQRPRRMVFGAEMPWICSTSESKGQVDIASLDYVHHTAVSAAPLLGFWIFKLKSMC
jgi:hypothetical protein